MPDDHVYGVRLFVSGTATTMAGWRSSLGRCGLTLDGHSLTSQAFGFRALAEWVENDGSFVHAFGLGTMSVEEQGAVNGAGSALVLDLPVYLSATAGEVATLIAALGDAGALGVRLEQSKLGWPVTHWVQGLESADPWMLYRCAVVVCRRTSGNPDGRTAGRKSTRDRPFGIVVSQPVDRATCQYG
jgi:hypothetical protein